MTDNFLTIRQPAVRPRLLHLSVAVVAVSARHVADVLFRVAAVVETVPSLRAAAAEQFEDGDDVVVEVASPSFGRQLPVAVEHRRRDSGEHAERRRPAAVRRRPPGPAAHRARGDRTRAVVEGHPETVRRERRQHVPQVPRSLCLPASARPTAWSSSYDKIRDKNIPACARMLHFYIPHCALNQCRPLANRSETNPRSDWRRA